LTRRPTRMSARALAGLGTAAGVVGIPSGLQYREAGWPLAAGAILLGIAAILRYEEERHPETPLLEGAPEGSPRTARAAIVCGVLALLATVYSLATGWTLGGMIAG
jgi:uncharacterized membrane protein (DUF4010 family)